MKKILCFLVCVAVLLSVLPTVTLAAAEKPVTVYNMDFDAYSPADSLDGIHQTAGTQSVVIDTDGNHYYRLSGASVNTNILMWYYHNEFAPDTVVQADYRVGQLTGPVRILLRDVNALGENLYINSEGYLYYTRTINGTEEKTVLSTVSCEESWVNIALAYHFDSYTYDVYINGSCAASGIEFETTELASDIYHVRFVTSSTESSSAYLDLDNIFIYQSASYYPSNQLEGTGGELLLEKELWSHEIDDSEISPDLSSFTAVEETPLVNPTARLTDYSEAKQAYSGAVCFAEGTSNIWIKDKKYQTAYQTIWEDERLLVAAPVLAALMDVTLTESGNSVQLGSVTATAGETYLTVNGQQITTAISVRSVDGTIYIPLEEFAIYGMKKWYGSSFLGLSVIAGEERSIHYETDTCRPNLYTVSNTSQMMAYLIMDRPNATRLTEIFNAAGERTRPYAVANQAELSQLQTLVKADETALAYSELVLQSADTLLQTTYTSSDTEGVQASPVFSTSEPWSLYRAYLESGDETYVERAEELALQMANLSHWSGTFHFLQTAQAMMSTAYFYDLFYNEFSQTTKDALAEAIINKGFLVAQAYYNGSTEGTQHDWCTRCTNWNCVPNSGIIIAAATLLGEGYNDDLCLEMLERAFVSLGYFMQYYAPDGGAGEGIGYTSFTLGYLCPAIDVLERVFGSDFGICDYPGFLEAGRFLTQATSFSYIYTLNDDAAEGRTNLSMALWFAKRNQDQALANTVLQYFEKNTDLKSAYAAIILQNYMAEGEAEALPLDAVYNGTELAFSRDRYDGNGTFLGVHGGYNHVAHGRYDYGTFIFDAFGIRFATETGADSYSLSSIGSFVHNAKYYTIRAEGHNVYVVNPDEAPGQNRYTYGRINVQEEKEKGVIYTLDMLPAYSQHVAEAKRGYMLTNDRKVFVLQDEITPQEGNCDDFYWFWHTYADVEIDDENHVITLTRDYKKVKLYFDATVDIQLTADALQPLSTSPAPEGQLETAAFKDMKKITAKFTGNGEPITFRVIAEPIGQTYERGELVPISEWTIPDGSCDAAYYSAAETITANGELLDGFSPEVYDYTVFYETADGLPPTIAARSTDGTVTVTQAKASGDTAVVKIASGSTPGNERIYTITVIDSTSDEIVSNRFIDCDFDDYTALTYNKSNENFYIGYSKTGTVAFPEETEGDKALYYQVNSANASGGTLDSTACVHLDHGIHLPEDTDWGKEAIEFSFKLDSYAYFRVGLFNVLSFETGRDGNLYGIYKNTSHRCIGTYEPNQWYRVKIVYDRTNLYDGIPRVFIYINSNEYAKEAGTTNSDLWQATLLNSQAPNFEGLFRITLFANEDTTAGFYFDDIKCYTIESPDDGYEHYQATWQLQQGTEKTDITDASQLTGGETVSMTVQLDNLTLKNKTNQMFFGLYQNGKLIDVASQRFTAAANTVTEQTIAETLTLPENLSAVVLKAYIWDYAAELTPLIKEYELTMAEGQ